MEKELLEKIYRLRKVTPADDFVRSTKQSIFSQEKETERESVLFSPAFQHGLVMAGAFAFILFFGSLALPLVPEYRAHVVSYPAELAERIREKEEEKDSKVAEHEDGERVEVAEKEQPVEKEFAALEEGLREIQRQVFGTKISSETGEERVSYSDREIAEYLVAELEGEDTEVGVMTMGAAEEESEEEDKDKAKRAKEALKEENYGEVFDIYLE